MREFRLAKLVRDNIVDGAISRGDEVQWRTLNDLEFVQALKAKLIEECGEIEQANGDELVKELADLQEIIVSLLPLLGVTEKQFAEVRRKKNQKAGSFKKRQYIETVKIDEGSEMLNYFLSDPKKFPEVK